MKHAWLIIAQNNISQLLKLIKFLDRDCNDIFIHMNMERHWGRTLFRENKETKYILKVF